MRADTEVPRRGYGYYHDENTDEAISAGRLRLSSWSTKSDPASAASVSREIVAALCRAGLSLGWEGQATGRAPSAVAQAPAELRPPLGNRHGRPLPCMPHARRAIDVE